MLVVSDSDRGTVSQSKPRLFWAFLNLAVGWERKATAGAAASRGWAHSPTLRATSTLTLVTGPGQGLPPEATQPGPGCQGGWRGSVCSPMPRHWSCVQGGIVRRGWASSRASVCVGHLLKQLLTACGSGPLAGVLPLPQQTLRVPPLTHCKALGSACPEPQLPVCDTGSPLFVELE